MDGKMKMEEHLIEELQLNGLGYRSIFENTGTVMLIVEEDMTISMANNEFEQLTGYKREEIEGKKKWIDFVHPSDLKGMIERHKLRRSDSNRAVRNYEFQLVHRDGSIRNILLTVDLIPKTKRSIASLLDITERKRAEDNLRASEKKYRDIFENAMEGIFQTTPDGHLLSANPALARMAGYGSPREMIDYVKNLGVQLYMNPDDRKHMIQMLAECGRLEGFEAQLYRKDGTPFWVSINIRTVRDAEGNIQYFEGTNTDITLRKRTEQELRHKHEQLSAAYQQLVAYDEEIRRKLEEHTQNQKALRASEEKYRILAENASDIIWSMDMDLQFTYVSPSAERLQGWTMEEWKSLRLEDVLTPASLEKVKKALEEELALEDTPGNGPTHARTIETEEYCKNGSTIHQEMTARFLRDPQGKPVGIMGVSRNIGERRRAQDALRESEARFRTLFDKNPYGIAIARNGMTLYVNNSCVRIFGYDDQSEIVGRPQLDGVAPASRAYIAEIIAKRNRGEPVPGIYEVVGIRKDGTEFPVRAQTVEIQLTDGPAIVSFFEDLTYRMRVEDALRESERRLAAIIDFLPDATLVIDGEGKVIAWNKAIEEMTGVKSENMLGRGNYEYAIPFYGERRPILVDLVLHTHGATEKKYVDIKKKENVLIGEAYMPALRGGEVYLLGMASTLKDSKGNVVGAIESIRDITERRKVEEKLEQSEERFSKAFHANPVPMMLSTIDEGCIIDVNDRLAEVYGYKREEMIGKTTGELGLWENPQERNRLVGELREKGFVRNALIYRHMATGDLMIALWSAAVINLEGMDVALSLQHDITEQKQAELKLKESEEKYRQIFENAIEGIDQATVGGKYLHVNPAFAHMFGYSSPQDMIDAITDIGRQTYVNPKEREYLVQRLQEKDKIEGVEVERYRKDGSKFWIMMNVHTVRDVEGRILYFEGTNIDITERKQAEEKHKKLESQLHQAQKMEAIGTLAGGIAHDFNNILTAMIGYSELAKSEEDREHRNDCLAQVLKACERAKDLVNQILTFSRKREMEKLPVQINLVIKEGLKLLRSSLPSTVEIHQSIETKPSIVIADPTQIHQILMNLSTNAAHAMRETGGILKVALSHERIGSVRTSGGQGLSAGAYAKLTVQDTGHGIDPAIMDRIFEPFFTTKQTGEGTGLGMSVVYGIVKSYGGAIDVASEPGQGTTINVYLPMVESLKTESDKSTVAEIHGRHEHVLFVDDEAMLVDLGERMLRHLGYQVTTRTSSIEALELFRARHGDFDLVITDMTMPNMTGAELAKRMLAIRPDMPIILCTGYSEIMTEENAREFGIRGYIMKPLTRKDLGVVIHEALKPVKQSGPSV